MAVPIAAIDEYDSFNSPENYVRLPWEIAWRQTKSETEAMNNPSYGAFWRCIT